MSQRVPSYRSEIRHTQERREIPVGPDDREERSDRPLRLDILRWKSRDRGFNSISFQYRQAVALRMVDELELPKESCILEIGCGAGTLTIALARRKYQIHAIDSVRASLNLLRQRALEVGLEGRIVTGLGDAHSLDFETDSHDLVLAIGVIPWLRSPDVALREIMRVLKPGGFAIFTVDNRWRLNHIIDPRYNPFLVPVWRAARGILERLNLKAKTITPLFPRKHSIRQFDALLSSVGLQKSAGLTLVFGPFSLIGKRILSEMAGQMLHQFLQRLADWDVPGIRSAGSQYLAVAQKPELSVLVSHPDDEKSMDALTMNKVL